MTSSDQTLPEDFGRAFVTGMHEVLTGAAHDLRNEYCIKVSGEVTPREEKDVNPNLPTGAVDVVASEIEVLDGVANATSLESQ